ncbi:MAG: hypoxanthine phosphoribosyltransferase, partial [Mycoplasmataceae bacterium]|nr:hypoxanthine phosphoribosyltransferase [Mycoplasmataceae bacterium]
MNKKFFEKIIFSKKEIQDKIVELAEWINTKYKDSENLVLISTMLGSIPFSMDLSKHIDIVHELDFIGVKSYYGGKQQSDCIVVDKEIDVNIKGKDVVILEDIIDSGRTLERIREILESREPN